MRKPKVKAVKQPRNNRAAHLAKHTWKPGISGNPRGRPRNAECLTSLLKVEIEKLCPTDTDGRTWKELLVIGTMRLAIAGSATALKEVWERMDGKVTQLLGVDGADSMEVTFKIHQWRPQPDRRR